MPVLILKDEDELKAYEGSYEDLVDKSSSADDFCLTDGNVLNWKEALACADQVCYMGICDDEVVFDKNKGKLLPTIIALGLIDEAESGLMVFTTGSIVRPFGSKKSFSAAIEGKKNKPKV